MESRDKSIERLILKQERRVSHQLSFKRFLQDKVAETTKTIQALRCDTTDLKRELLNITRGRKLDEIEKIEREERFKKDEAIARTVIEETSLAAAAAKHGMSVSTVSVRFHRFVRMNKIICGKGLSDKKLAVQEYFNEKDLPRPS